jgi:hypothetical protein
MINFITQNKELLSFIIAIFAGVFTAIKYLDTRKRELQEKRYAKYMDLIAMISGTRPDGNHAKITEQVAAVWFLLEYTEYYYLTHKIFEANDFSSIGNNEWTTYIVPQIRLLLKETQNIKVTVKK